MILDHRHDPVAFRQAVRAWLSEVAPSDWHTTLAGADDAAFVAFQRWWMSEMDKAGLATAHWAQGWGGVDLPLEMQVIVNEEIARADAPELSLYVVALFHVPATLSAFGTEAQRERYIPGVRRGETWCQGFSEPNAGSDLAALRTRAERVGDEYIINGQKLWSSQAMHADFCLLLARTDPAAPKHKGISYFIMDMKSPGIDVRPIRQINGQAEFAEMFLDNVRIPAENLIGAENQGWQVAQATLSAERGLIVLEYSERLRRSLDLYFRDEVARDAAWLGDAEMRRRFIGFIGRTQAVSGLVRRLLAEQLEDHGAASITPCYIKVAYSELLREIADFQIQVQGLAGLRDQPGAPCAPYLTGDAFYDYVRTWMLTIAGGTNEIMRNLIAERGLGMPR